MDSQNIKEKNEILKRMIKIFSLSNQCVVNMVHIYLPDALYENFYIEGLTFEEAL